MSMQKRRKQRRQNDDKDEDEEAEQGSAGAETTAWARRRRGLSEPFQQTLLWTNVYQSTHSRLRAQAAETEAEERAVTCGSKL